ncbi:MAG: DUF2513 domain-containing protein [Methylobacter sp.]|nr:DUF2513 domain-containing protein [Methylobacter sp.]MDP2169636.1 DUF2513 domain-containing protein [Rhodocyclaceae bacterium]MDP2429052.1 DUF2513 domain-containing protein [Methylobacter sp.]MDP3056553.1 DUF2513 domain-containing protein [Methylobacter sp.]MDP3362042.1 DUF2513 domain-containing protein [Methylobacter sp.]
MQRNWDIIRKILLKVEALPTEGSDFYSADLADTDAETSAYHMRLLLEAGLIIGGCRDALGPPSCHANRLTWEGHEFLDKIKNETLWQRIKATARSKGIDLSFTVIKDVAKVLIAGALL